MPGTSRQGRPGTGQVLARAVTATLALALAGGAGALVAPGPAYAKTVRDYQQWYLDALKLSQAHKLSKGDGVVVAVIDSGVYADHPDLSGQVLPGHGFGPDASADGRSDPDMTTGHGTGMAGIIAGKGGGVDHVLGIAPRAKILPVSLGGSKDNLDPVNVAEGIRWAADHGADVISVSLTGQTPTPQEVSATSYALGKDAVVVAAAGNRAQNHLAVGSPANIPGVVAVSATTKSGNFWPGSATGPAMVIGVPGDGIIFPVPSSASDNGYLMDSSTSVATAVASGAVALIRARYPDLNAASVINRLIKTADDKGPAGRDPQYGFGAIDPVAALTASVPKVDANPLLGGSGKPGGQASAPATGGKDDDKPPAVSLGYNGNTGQLLMCIGLVLLPVIIIVVLIVINRRAKRKRLAAGPPLPMGPAPVGPQPGAQWAARPGTPMQQPWTGAPAQPGAPPPWPGQQAPPAPPRGYPPAQPGQPGVPPAQPGHPAPPYGAQPPAGPGWQPPAPPPGGGRG